MADRQAPTSDPRVQANPPHVPTVVPEADSTDERVGGIHLPEGSEEALAAEIAARASESGIVGLGVVPARDGAGRR